jgi:phosphoglycolate phosphatase-like HAD superfamily hydrolase
MFVCLFDIDGTLLSSGGAGKAAMEKALASTFGVPDSAGEVPFSGRTDRLIARDLFALHGVDDSLQNWERFRQGYLSHLPECLRSYRGKVLPGIFDLLELLRRRSDVSIGLLTGNIRDGAKLKLGHYGIYHYFAFGGFGDHHLDRDEVAREALASLQAHLQGRARLDRVWVIGDTPLDVRCARAIGARVAAVATGYHSVQELHAAEPDVVLQDFSDPAPLMQLWA